VCVGSHAVGRCSIMLTNARLCTSEVPMCIALHLSTLYSIYISEAGTSSSFIWWNGHQLDVVTTEKDLGVIISSNLKVAEHCYDAYSKANKMPRLVPRTIKHISPDLMVRMYKSLVRPRALRALNILYCDWMWLNAVIRWADCSSIVATNARICFVADSVSLYSTATD